ncbi:GlpM family protein [Salmonella enterica subsp. enterica]|nr:GlpM family protein [Salmonella enterica subsp. enterica]
MLSTGLQIKVLPRVGRRIDWVCCQNEKLLYRAGLIPFCFNVCAIAHYISTRAGIDAMRTTIVFSMWSIIPLFHLSCNAMVFQRRCACPSRLAVRWSAGGCCGC